MKERADEIAANSSIVYIGATVQVVRRWRGWSGDPSGRRGCPGHKRKWHLMTILGCCLHGRGPAVEKELIRYMKLESPFRSKVVNKAVDSRGLPRTGTSFMYVCSLEMDDYLLNEYIE